MTILRLQHASVPMPPGGGATARQFYTDIVGLEELPLPKRLDPERAIWYRVGEGGHEFHLFTDANLAHASSLQHFCLEVENVDGYRELLESKGYPIFEEPDITYRYRFCTHDPFGNRVEFCEILGDYD